MIKFLFVVAAFSTGIISMISAYKYAMKKQLKSFTPHQFAATVGTIVLALWVLIIYQLDQLGWYPD